ncbi:tetratricopeptide repeat protein [Microcystis aeruginosa FBCC-A68]|nr:tetratricopeptide repeat protein [Microcystis aeruginosa]
MTLRVRNVGYNLGRFAEAIASFDRALEFKPDLHQAWNNRGFALGTSRE